MTFDLEPRFLMPSGWQWGEFTRAGRRIRTGYLPHPNQHGTVVYLPGFGEFSEKNFETFRDLHARGFSVHTMDWYGQGGSGRYLANPEKRHSSGFSADIKDLKLFLKKTFPTKPPHPFILLGHSMGGHLGMRYLAKHPDVFDCAAFTAPMIGIYALRLLPISVALRVTGLADRIRSQAYVPGGADWRPYKHRPDEGRAHLSADPARNSLQNLWFASRPDLRCGGPTYGWLHRAMRSCALLRKQLGQITTPCLLALAGRDILVDNAAILRASRIIPRAELVVLPESQHEILMEIDAIRNAFLAGFDRLIAALETP